MSGLMEEMASKASRLNIPLNVQLDLTYRCNERCVHCYLDHNDHGEMTTAEIKHLLDEMAEAQVRPSSTVGRGYCRCSNTTLPPTIVVSTLVRLISCGLMEKMSCDRTARSASFPASSVPSRSSENLA